MLKVSYEKHVIECTGYYIIGQGGHGSQFFLNILDIKCVRSSKS